LKSNSKKAAVYFFLLITTLIAHAQVSVSVDENASWLGYMHRYENVNGSKGSYIGGQQFTVVNLTALISTDGSQTITLKPNTSQYNASDSYWSNGAGDGNKWLGAETYVEYGANTYPGGTLTFAGNIDSYTLDARYTMKAYVKEFTSSFSLINSTSVDITASTTTFSFSYTPTNNNNVIQYGFLLEGLNANPATDWGSVLISATASDLVYQEVWADEFGEDGSTDVSEIDGTKWFHQTIIPNGYNWYNEELQHYTDRTDNSYVSNGTLKIVAKRESYTDQGHTKMFTSARLNSKFAFTYGIVEVRAKLPTGVGTWPAIWTLGKNINERGAYWQQQGYGTTNWPACGEIDIMEHWGKNQNHVSSAMHTPSSSGGTINYGGQTISTASTEFHIYKLVWTPEKMEFSVDGNIHYTYNPSSKNDQTWPFDKDQFLLLNIAIEKGTQDTNFSESAMEIDYVRVYQLQQTLSTPSIAQEPLFKLWVNSANNNIHISAPSYIDDITIYNLVGQEVYQQKLNRKNAVITPVITKGVYILKVTSGSEWWTRKILVN